MATTNREVTNEEAMVSNLYRMENIFHSYIPIDISKYFVLDNNTGITRR